VVFSVPGRINLFGKGPGVSLCAAREKGGYAELSAIVQDVEGKKGNLIPLMRPLPHCIFIYQFVHTTSLPDSQHFRVSDKTVSMLVFEALDLFR